MTKLLTIAIPTYNRAKLLDIQLAWLAQAVKGFEGEIEIFVSDNCSTDNTQDVIKRWEAQLRNITFHSCRNAENIGLNGNIMNCLTSAKTKYVWAIGDDDPIEDRAISYTINKLREYSDLSLLFLNYSGRNQVTGEPTHPRTIVGNRWFDIESEDGKRDSKAVFEHCMAKSVGAVIFLTATVYRTDLVLSAARTWAEGVSNFFYLAYLAGYCAAQGRTVVTKENYLECIVGVSHWQQDPQVSLLIQYKHLPEVVGKLAEIGYSKQFYRAMMVQTLKDANLRVFLGGLARWPALASSTLIPFLSFVGRAVIGAAPSQKSKMADFQPS